MEVLMNSKRYAYDDARYVLLKTGDFDLKKTFILLEMGNHNWQRLYAAIGYQGHLFCEDFQR